MGARGVWFAALFLAACSQPQPTSDADVDAPADSSIDAPSPCRPGCSSVQLCCALSSGNRCVDQYSDPENCGACGNTCGGSELCVDRVCVDIADLPDAHVEPPDAYRAVPDAFRDGCDPDCAAAYICCGTTCVPRDAGGCP